MTVNELQEAVKKLIGEYDYFDSDVFKAAANTALGTLFSETEPTDRASIYLTSPKILNHIPLIRHTAGSTERVVLEGAAYSMRLFGRGSVSITDGQSTLTQSFDGQGTVLRGFIKHGGVLNFSGEFAYSVKDVTLFSECESAKTEDIPVLGEKRRIRISDYVSDFSRAVSYPADSRGAFLKNVLIENEYLVCPKSFSGEVCFSYKKRAPRISVDLPEAEIPVSPEAHSALTLLTAAYMLGESECDAAEFFLKEYKRTLARISAQMRPSVSGAYFDTTGWA